MGDTSDASESEPDASEEADPPPHSPTFRSQVFARFVLILVLSFTALTLTRPVFADALDRVKTTHRLSFGADEEGGAPYFFKDANDHRIGFEAELMEKVARSLGAEPDFQQGQWEYLLQVLGRGKFDAVVNGYELTTLRSRDFLATRPYYVYQLQLMALRDGPVRSWADFELPRPGGGPWRVGVMGMSAADSYAKKNQGTNLEITLFDGATNAMLAVKNGQIDATLQDFPAARHYIKTPEFRDALKLAGPPEGSGYYVIYTRKEDVALRDAIDREIGRLIDSGELEAIYRKYDIWNDAQRTLSAKPRADVEALSDRRPMFDLDLLRRFGPRLGLAALVTIALSCTAMPLAMALGLGVAIGRIYGPAPLGRLLACYVELVRGTPLIIQLYFLYYVLPRLGITLDAWTAGVLGLAINYSAYEAEIYRAGLQAIPKGQMEAALALGMSPILAIRRVIVPQALRIVIPPVTSDFIALFKDTSVCSVITLTELTKQYSILFNSQGGVIEFGLATAVLYMAMSLPLSWFSRWVERRLDAGPRKGVIG
jgi:polar amino acid transport system substrate-binding protein